MRTKIEATWIVGHERGQHTLIRDGELVFEGNRILHVGKAFEGKVDRVIDAKGKLLSPGFIDTHVHSGHRASHRLITDSGRPMYYGQPFLEISVPKEGKVVKGDPRYLKHGDAGSAAAFKLNAAFTVAEVVRLGSRAYLAPGYDCGRWVADESGRLKRVRNDALGHEGLKTALAWIEKNDGAADGRVRGILVPREVETSSVELLQDTLRAADERKLPM